MTERNPISPKILDFEEPITNLDNGLHALGAVVQAFVEDYPEVDISAIYFVERGLRAVHDDLRAMFDALHASNTAL